MPVPGLVPKRPFPGFQAKKPGETVAPALLQVRVREFMVIE